MYLGFEFKELLTGTVYTKGELWDYFRLQALSAQKISKSTPLTQTVAPEGFELCTICKRKCNFI